MYHSRRRASHKHFSKKKEVHRKEIANAVEEFLKKKEGKNSVELLEEAKETKVIHYADRRLIYEEYMASDEWKVDKRKEAMDHLGTKCEICKHGKSLQLHHNNYRSLLQENVQEDLALVCWSCHTKFHKKVKGSKLTGSPGFLGMTCRMCCGLATCRIKTEHRDFSLCRRCAVIFKKELRYKKVEYEPGAKRLSYKRRKPKNKKRVIPRRKTKKKVVKAPKEPTYVKIRRRRTPK